MRPPLPPRPLPPGPGAPTAHLPSWLGASRTARAAPPPDGSSGSRNRGREAQRAARAGEGPDARPQEARPGSTGGGGAAGSPQRGTWPLRAQLRAPRGSPPMPAPLPAGPQTAPGPARLLTRQAGEGTMGFVRGTGAAPTGPGFQRAQGPALTCVTDCSLAHRHTRGARPCSQDAPRGTDPRGFT